MDVSPGLKSFLFFSVRLLSVLRDHSGFFIPATTTNDLRLRRIFYPRFILSITFFPILTLQKEPVFPFSMLSAKQWNYWYHYYIVFGMTRSLTGDWTRDLPHSKVNVFKCTLAVFHGMLVVLVMFACTCTYHLHSVGSFRFLHEYIVSVLLKEPHCLWIKSNNNWIL